MLFFLQTTKIPHNIRINLDLQLLTIIKLLPVQYKPNKNLKLKSCQKSKLDIKNCLSKMSKYSRFTKFKYVQLYNNDVDRSQMNVGDRKIPILPNKVNQNTINLLYLGN